jgi:serine/threonine protein kinase
MTPINLDLIDYSHTQKLKDFAQKELNAIYILSNLSKNQSPVKTDKTLPNIVKPIVKPSSKKSNFKSLSNLLEKKKISLLNDVNNKLGEGSFSTVWKAVSKTGLQALKITKDTYLEGTSKYVNQIEYHPGFGDSLALYTTGARLQKLEHVVFQNKSHFSEVPSNESKIAATIGPIYPGVSLGDFLYEYILTDQYIIDLALEIALAIKELQKDQIIHRDLHTGNILVDFDDPKFNIKIIDFTFAKRIGATSPTQKIGLCGKKTVVAPERFDPNTISDPYKEDIWAFGSILQRLYSNTFLSSENYQAFSDSEVEIQFKELIETTLQKKPADRIDIDSIINSLNKMKEHYICEQGI